MEGMSPICRTGPTSTLQVPNSPSRHLDTMLNAACKATCPSLPIASLPDGAFIEVSDDDYRLKWAGALHR